MLESWYEVVDADTSLTQGDLIFECPLLTWDAVAPSAGSGPLQVPVPCRSQR